MMKSLNLLAMALLLTACTKDLADDEHYKVSSDVKGSAYSVLQKEGTYQSFLRGIELCGSKDGTPYTDIVDGKILVTVMAPDDDAFAEFLKGRGYSSIDEMYQSEPEYVEKMIKFHLMNYAFNWDKMVNFRPSEGDGATDEQKDVDAGYYYKHRTFSKDGIEAKTADTLIYHYERYLPVFSYRMFETKDIDAAYNYQYFFPQTQWGPTFNVANAAVKDKESVITDNGYLYHINKVLEPMETIYGYLCQNDRYSDFVKICNQYLYYVKDEEQSTNTGQTVYVPSFRNIPNIALEWPATDWKQFSSLEKKGYNLFAPSNAAISNFFTSYWKPGCGYSSLLTLDSKIQEYFIKQCFASLQEVGSTSRVDMIIFPEEIKNGQALTAYDTQITIDPEQVDDRVMCVNGVVYGMDKMEAPALFSSVAGPAFSDVRYLPYLYALDGCGMINSLASDNTSFIALIPDTAQFTASKMRLYQTVSGKELQAYSEEVGDYAKMSSSQMQNIVNLHTAAVSQATLEQLTNNASSQSMVIESNAVFNYWFIKDGKITTSALFNHQLNETYDAQTDKIWVELNNQQKWNNGYSFCYGTTPLLNNGIFEASSGDGLAYKLAVCADSRYPYYLFAQLLQKAGLAGSFKSDTEEWTGLATTIQSRYNGEVARFITFIPTNEAIKEHIKEIPGCGKLSISDDYKITGTPTKAQLADYLMSYFITSSYNPLTTYPYVGCEKSNPYRTESIDKQIIITDDGKALYVGYDSSSLVVRVNDKYDYFPFAFADGCFHLIDGILQ